MFPPPVGVGAAVVVVHPAGVGDGVVVGMGSNAVGLVLPMVRGAVTDGVGRAVGNIVVTTGIGAVGVPTVGVPTVGVPTVGVPTVGVFVKSPMLRFGSSGGRDGCCCG